MIPTLFAAEETATKGLPLGLSLSAFVVQLVTFILAFVVLKKFAFSPIVKLLEKRRQTIEDGVLLGEKMEKVQANLKVQGEEIIREARNSADNIVAIAHKESRDVIQKAEKDAKLKAETIIKDADAQIGEDAERARRGVEKDIVGLVSEATEAVVHEKVNAKKDSEVIDKVLRSRNK